MNSNTFTVKSAIALMVACFFAACSGPAPVAEENNTVPVAEISATPGTTTPAPADSLKQDAVYLIKTTMGDIKVKVYKECPLHQANFDKLVSSKYYDGVLFHRVIKEFMIQTGDPDSKAAQPGAQYGAGGPNYTIPAEILPQFYHKKGALAAARQGDEVNPYKASSGSQFYIVHGKKLTDQELNGIMMQTGVKFSPQAINDYKTIGGAAFLDGQYTVFGETLSGLDIVDKIATVKTLSGDRPVTDIKIISIEKVTE